MAEPTSTELAVAGGDTSYSDSLELEQKSGFMDALNNVDVMRQVTIVVSLVICIAIAVFIMLWAHEAEYRPLPKMDTQELIETLDYLDANYPDYRLEGGMVYVLESDYKSVKINMTREGLSASTSSNEGTDIIMQDMGFGVSQRVEKERLKHAREQQIARTIEEMNGIARAKVLLALPKENVFARREKKASATVVITSGRGSVIDGEEVDSIVDIVASAVQGMEPNRVTVTDSNGRLLNSGSQNAASSRSRKEYEMEKQREAAYLQKIDSILIPVLGLGNYTAQADVTMDFTAVEQTQRNYNPDLPAIRSEMLIENNSTGSAVGGIPGALTNQPPLDSNIPEQATASNAQIAMPGRSSKEETRNYELDTTISHTKQQTGIIKRLSVSVAVDYISVTAEDGTVTTQPKAQQELLNLRRLLQGGIGFNVTRGDSLEVVSIPFNRESEFVPDSIPFYEREGILQMAKWATGALIIIVLIFALVKPMLSRLINPQDTTEADDFDIDSALDLGDETISMLSQEFDEGQVGFAADGSLMLPDLHKDEDVLKAVRALVANEPELSAQVVKGWLMQDE